MKKLDKETMIKDFLGCLGMVKIPEKEIVEGKLFIEGLGNYQRIPNKRIERKIVEFDDWDNTIVYHTDKTEINSDFIEKAKEVCRTMGWDWEFKIFENDESDMPMIFINEESIAFIIAPRDRKWFKGKSTAQAFKLLEITQNDNKENQDE